MGVSFTPEINYRADSRGNHLVQIRCSEKGKHKRFSLGISIPSKHWDFDKKEVKKVNGCASEYNRIINGWLLKLSKVYAQLMEEKADTSLDELLFAVSAPKVVSFFQFAETTKLAEFKAKGKMGTYRRYEAVLNKLRVYAPKLTMSNLDYRFFRDYQMYLIETLGNSKDTVSSNLSVIRTIVNEAIASGVFTKQNPFLQIKLQYTDNTKAKLTMNELHRFQSCSFPDIRSLHLAQDFFMACFYANGCRAGDMATMTVSNIQNGYLCYTQGKTGKKMIVGLSDELNAIFLKYRCDTRACIFPLFEDNDTINERTINSKITYLNKYIREVAKYAGIVKKLSTHCARHTFMDHALSASGGNIYEIKEMAGHSSVKTTEVYLRQRVNGIGDGIRNKVLETLKGVGINE